MNYELKPVVSGKVFYVKAIKAIDISTLRKSRNMKDMFFYYVNTFFYEPPFGANAPLSPGGGKLLNDKGL